MLKVGEIDWKQDKKNIPKNLPVSEVNKIKTLFFLVNCNKINNIKIVLNQIIQKIKL